MFSGSTSGYPSTPGSHQNQDPNRPPFSQSHSYTQPFTVAGMSSPGAAHMQSPNLRGGSLSGSGFNPAGSLGMGDSQSRTYYQPGYLMSVTQNNAPSQSSQRYDDPPIVQTKAKMHSILSGTSASEFGMSSMFESSRERQRQTLADEDAPPTSSVNDIVNEVYNDTALSRRQQIAAFDSPARASLFRPAQSQAPSTPKPLTSTALKPLHVIVFGYPPDKYSATVEYFRAFGDTTEPDQNTEIMNCFRLGYTNPADALRAIRKSGDIIGGCWMVGVKWADPAQAESVLGLSLARSTMSYTPTHEASSPSPDVTMSSSPPSSNVFGSGRDASLVLSTAQRGSAGGTPTVGTPIKLAPSASAFRKPGTSAKATPKAGPSDGTPGFVGALPVQPGGALQQSPSKSSMLGQVSDLIFGW